jgi:O-antigen/teichoic acid export membrane protein
VIDYRAASHKDLRNHFLKNTSFYGFGFLLVRAGGVLLLPLYWTKLEPADFGIVTISQMILAVLAPILTLSCSDSVERLYHEWKPEERKTYMGALWVFSSVFALMICSILDLFGNSIFSVLIESVPFQPFLRIALWTTFATSLTNVPLSLLKIREEISHYTVATIFWFILQTALVLVFLFVYDIGIVGFLLAGLISSVVMAAYFIWIMRKEIRFDFTKRHLKEPLAYSLPFIPNTVFEGIGAALDRFFLDKYATLAVIGIYGLGYQIASSLSIFNRVVKSSWLPFLFRVVADREDAPQVLSRFTLYHVATLIMPALLLAVLAKDVILLVNNPKYFDVAIFIPYFVLVYFIISLAISLGRGMDLSKKTWPSIAVPIVSVVTNLTALSILVPKYGAWGAVAAALIAATFKVTVQTALAHWFYPRPTPFKLIIGIFAIGLMTFAISTQISFNNLFLNLGLKLILLAISFWTIAVLVVGQSNLNKAIATGYQRISQRRK